MQLVNQDEDGRKGGRVCVCEIIIQVRHARKGGTQGGMGVCGSVVVATMTMVAI